MGKVILTGDVHHMSSGTREQRYIRPFNELDLSLTYLEIAARYGLKVTFFITGKTFEEENEKIPSLLKFSNVEIGGHTFNAFHPIWLHRISKVVNGSYWLSSKHQISEVKNTCEIIKRVTGITITSWRNHCYDYNNDTISILLDNGIEVWSDELSEKYFKPYCLNGITALPINIISDHEVLFHGFKTPDWFLKQKYTNLIKKLIGRGNVYPQGFTREKWFCSVEKGIEEKANKGVAVLNIHPACMYLLDEFQTFEKICELLSQNETFFAKDALTLL